MAKENCQKIKLLKLQELLRQESDEQHPLTTMMIIERLSSMGISCERRTLAKDIALLNEQGYEVMSCWVNKEKGYYVEDRSFSVPELKILIDAVQAASFITENKTVELIDKISGLGGSHRADILKCNMVHFNTRKHTNESIYYNVDALENALQNHKKVIFKYYDLNLNLERVYRREGHRYTAEPIALVFNEDNYYLVCFSAKHDGITNYRVDRMDTVEVIEDDVSAKALAFRDRIGEYTGQAIKMFSGEPEEVVLEFDNRLIGSVYDRFGENTNIIASGGKCMATVRIQKSPTFWGWLFQFGNDMKILSPESAVKEYHGRIAELRTGEE